MRDHKDCRELLATFRARENGFIHPHEKIQDLHAQLVHDGSCKGYNGIGRPGPMQDVAVWEKKEVGRAPVNVKLLCKERAH